MALNYCVIAVNCLQIQGCFSILCTFCSSVPLLWQHIMSCNTDNNNTMLPASVDPLSNYIPLSKILLVILYTLLRRRGELSYYRRQENVYFAFELCIDLGLFHSFHSILMFIVIVAATSFKRRKEEIYEKIFNFT